MAEDVISALEAEQERLEAMLSGLPAGDWDAPSACEGWTVSDVVLHLAQTEEAVIASIRGESLPFRSSGDSVDAIVAGWVAAETGSEPAAVFERWKNARRLGLSALQEADPGTGVAWAATPLKPRTLATTRLSEHWIHGLDISGPLGRPYPDTDRLWHVARLAHRTLPYAYGLAGRGEPPKVRLELTGPDGSPWTFGPDETATVIAGKAGEFCRVAARRMDARGAISLEAEGPGADEVLELVRTYA